MRYYGRTVDNPRAANYQEVTDVGRWYKNEEGNIALERWVNGEWVSWPSLIEASGMGGSNPFMPMTENDVKRWMRDRDQEWEEAAGPGKGWWGPPKGTHGAGKAAGEGGTAAYPERTDEWGVTAGEEWRGELTPDEAGAIDEYQKTKHRVDNIVLRRGEGTDDKSNPPYGWDAADAARIDATTSALDKASLPDDVMVFRGFSSERAGDRMGQLKPGTTFTDKSFVSTSVDSRYALKEFGSPGAVRGARITVPKGSKAAYLSKKGERSSEYELLVQRGSRFEVTGFSKVGDYTVIDLRYTGSSPAGFWRSFDDWEDVAID